MNRDELAWQIYLRSLDEWMYSADTLKIKAEYAFGAVDEFLKVRDEKRGPPVKLPTAPPGV